MGENALLKSAIRPLERQDIIQCSIVLWKESKVTKFDVEFQSDSEPEVEQIGDAPEKVPFSIPEKWKWLPLGSIGDWKAGATPSRTNKEYYAKGNVPWLKTGDLNNGLIESVPEFITEKALQECSVRLNPPGSVLIAMYGATIGKVGLLAFPCTTNQACCACIPKHNLISSKWLFYYLLSQKKYFIGQSSGGAQPNISRTKIVAHLIPLPSLEEQDRIISKLELLLTEIDNSEKAYNELTDSLAEQYKALILDKAMRGHLVPQLDSEPEVEQIGEVSEDVPLEIPAKWKWIKLENLSREMADGPFGSNLKKEHYTNKHEVRIIQLSNIGEHGWRDENVRYTTHTHAETIPRSRVNSGDIVIAKMMPAGRAVIVPDSDASYVLCSDAVKVVVKTELILTKFLNFAINSQIFKQQVYANVQGTTRVRTSLSKLKTYQIPVPPLNEQCRIVSKIEELFSQVKKISV